MKEFDKRILICWLNFGQADDTKITTPTRNVTVDLHNILCKNM